jgi:hypothetical protein
MEVRIVVIVVSLHIFLAYGFLCVFSWCVFFVDSSFIFFVHFLRVVSLALCDFFCAVSLCGFFVRCHCAVSLCGFIVRFHCAVSLGSFIVSFLCMFSLCVFFVCFLCAFCTFSLCVN